MSTTPTAAETTRALLAELLDRYTEKRELWIEANGDDAGFDAWFTGQVIETHHPAPVDAGNPDPVARSIRNRRRVLRLYGKGFVLEAWNLNTQDPMAVKLTPREFSRAMEKQLKAGNLMAANTQALADDLAAAGARIRAATR